MTISLTKSQTILIKNSLNMMRSYIKELNMNNDKLLSSSKEYKEIDNILDKLSDFNPYLLSKDILT